MCPLCLKINDHGSTDTAHRRDTRGGGSSGERGDRSGVGGSYDTGTQREMSRRVEAGPHGGRYGLEICLLLGARFSGTGALLVGV